jgi:hypothetical protein
MKPLLPALLPPLWLLLPLPLHLLHLLPLLPLQLPAQAIL